jgi:branched-chain amino acid transport system permease protein
MSALRLQLDEWRGRLPSWSERAFVGALIVIAILLPFAFPTSGIFIESAVIALAYAVMALGLNVVVGFAGLLDLGYVAFYAVGAYSAAWFGSFFFFKANIHILSTAPSADIGIHLNFLIILILAAVLCTIAGMIIGLPTLRLRGDYIAIVTLAFGELIRVVARNGQDIHLGGGMTLTGGSTGISGIDSPLFGHGALKFNDINQRPWYWLILGILLVVLFCALRLRNSRLGRAWIALREDEVAAISMGVPAVRTKLTAYAVGAAFGGLSGAFLGSHDISVSSDYFEFGFSILILAMIIVGGLGSIWGAVVGGLVFGYINHWLLPDVLNSLPSKLGLNFPLSEIEFGIYGFLLIVMMLLRPQGIIPERRRRLEMTGEIAAQDAELGEAPA